jgi:hypothetical protein
MAKQSTKKKEAAANAQPSPTSGENNGVEEAAGQEAGADPIALLTEDHRKVEQIFKQFESAADAAQKEQFAQQACRELIVHAMLEEELFYPACRAAGVESDMLDEAQVEHDGAKVLILDIQQGKAADEFYDAKVKVLSEYILHHVKEEEKSDGIFAKAKTSSLNLPELGGRIQRRKQELTQQGEQLPRPEIHSIEIDGISPQQQRTNLFSSEEDQMYRNSNDRERDSRGRFESEDRGRGRSRAQSSGEYMDDDRDNRDERGSGQGWHGDSEGHREAAEQRGEGRGGRRGYSSSRDQDDEEYGRSSGRGGSYASRGRDEDDDDDRRSGSRGEGRGQSGWFGDSEGHREAAESRSDSRSGGSRRGYSSRDEEDEDDGRSSNRSGGYASRDRGGDEDERRSGGSSSGQRGWFGDSEGHREAAESRREGRSGGSSRGSSRSSDDNDDHGHRSSHRSGSSHGGWFGDSEGHREAAEARWEGRSGGSSRSSSRGREDDHDNGRSSGRSGGSRSHGGWFGDSEGHREAAEARWEGQSGGSRRGQRH